MPKHGREAPATAPVTTPPTRRSYSFILDDHDRLFLFPHALESRLATHTPSANLTQFAGQRLRRVDALVQLDQRRPVHVLRLQYDHLTFNADGWIEPINLQALQDTLIAAIHTTSLPAPPPAPSWTPSPTLLERIYTAAFHPQTISSITPDPATLTDAIATQRPIPLTATSSDPPCNWLPRGPFGLYPLFMPGPYTIDPNTGTLTERPPYPPPAVWCIFCDNSTQRTFQLHIRRALGLMLYTCPCTAVGATPDSTFTPLPLDQATRIATDKLTYYERRYIGIYESDWTEPSRRFVWSNRHASNGILQCMRALLSCSRHWRPQ